MRTIVKDSFQNQNQMMNLERAKEIAGIAILTLIEKFMNQPTIFLEEKHLHNEFDRIIKDLLLTEQLPTHSKTKDGHDFPIVMNEYTTISKFKKEDSFQMVYEDDGHPGSIDYVMLDENWIQKNTYLTCVNKDEDSRKLTRKLSENPYLVSVEFKFLHFGKEYKSYDELQNSKEIFKETKESRLKKIKKEILEDACKQLHEIVPSPNVVYFNSELPLPEEETLGLLKEIKKTLDAKNLTLWYAQAGVSYRFKTEENFYHLKE
ncbi:hypothetical protein P3G55_02310 [Leptospira sp. 96542]|nr:hypothetical protein [Leptospira sp. 96542]